MACRSFPGHGRGSGPGGTDCACGLLHGRYASHMAGPAGGSGSILGGAPAAVPELWTPGSPLGVAVLARARTWAPWLVGKERSIDPENAAHGRHWTTTYPVAALFPMMALVRETLGGISAPSTRPLGSPITPMMTSSACRRCAARCVALGLSRPGTSARRAGFKHVIAGDAFAPEATSAVPSSALAFLAAEGLGCPRHKAQGPQGAQQGEDREPLK